MKQLYSAKDGLEAHDVRLFLESRDISAKVVGDNSPLEAGFSFTPASAPCVFVAPEDHNRALAALQEYLNSAGELPPQGNWKCSNCGQVVETQFDTCWKCAAPRQDELFDGSAPVATTASEVEQAVVMLSDRDVLVSSPDAVTATASFPQIATTGEDRREVSLEMIAVLAVAWFPYFAYGILPDLYASETPDSFVSYSIWSIVSCISISTVVAYIMYRSKLPWAAFGITRPRWIRDFFLGILVWLITAFVAGTLYAIAATAVGTEEVVSFTETSYQFARASEALDYALILLFSFAVGLSEELAMRSYLIPRLEFLLNSTWKSILISSLLFASYHLYQGFGAAVVIFIVGISLGCAFCWLRRLWPLVWAHALMDVIAFSIHGN